MLRKRSRVVSKQGVMMSDHSSIPSPSHKSSSPIFASPRLLVAYSTKLPSESEAAAAVSPTSILETKPFTSNGNPFFSDSKPRATAVAGHRSWGTMDSRAVGLGIVDALSRDERQPDHWKTCNPDSRMVLFGSQLKIQVPSISPTGSVESPINSPIEFGVKNKSSQLALLSPALKPPIGCAANAAARFSLSADDMELSEDYTCVIAHGPNPRTTHIFDNCIVENCGGRRDGVVHAPRELNSHLSPYRSVLPTDDFLAFCHACKKRLGPGKDIFMHRGEKAFCSSECRYQEMMFDDEGMEMASRDSSPDL